MRKTIIKILLVLFFPIWAFFYLIWFIVGEVYKIYFEKDKYETP
jgi:hypothetical protein